MANALKRVKYIFPLAFVRFFLRLFGGVGLRLRLVSGWIAINKFIRNGKVEGCWRLLSIPGFFCLLRLIRLLGSKLLELCFVFSFLFFYVLLKFFYMAKVIGPLLSLKASGTFAGTLYVRCGQVMCKKPMSDIDGIPDDELNDQQKLFQQAVKVWQSLTPEQKRIWKNTEINAYLKTMCLATILGLPLAMTFASYFQGPPPLGWVKSIYGVYYASKYLFPIRFLGLLSIASLFATIGGFYITSGYNLFMSTYLLTKGRAWENYPMPPPAFLKPE